MKRMSKLHKLKARNTSSGRRLEEMAADIEEHGQMIAEQGQKIEASMHKTADLARQVAKDLREVRGSVRKLGDRFDAILQVSEGQQTSDRARLQRLEQQRLPPGENGQPAGRLSSLRQQPRVPDTF